MRRLRSVVAATVLAVAAFSVVLVPASAEVADVGDETYDQTVLRGPRTDRETADLYILRTYHNEQRVTLRFFMLQMLQDGRSDATAVVRTNEGFRFQLRYLYAPAQELERLTVTRVDDGRRQRVTCSGARGDQIVEKEDIRISVPRRCLSQPRWVQTGAFVETQPSAGGLFIDDVRRDGNADYNDIKVGGLKLRSGPPT